MARACCESTFVSERLVMPLASAPTMPGSSRVPGRPRWKVAVFARPSSLQDRLVEERKIAGSTNGRRIFALVIAGCRFSRLAKRLALRLLSLVLKAKGLSSLARPCNVLEALLQAVQTLNALRARQKWHARSASDKQALLSSEARYCGLKREPEFGIQGGTEMPTLPPCAA